MAFFVLGVISSEEHEHATVPGLERAVPKSKGQEVGSVLHQMGVLVGRNPHNPAVRKLLLEIEPGCKDRLPRRVTKVDGVSPPPAEPQAPSPSQTKKKTASRGGPSEGATKPKKSKKIPKVTGSDRRAAETGQRKKKTKTSAAKAAVKKKGATQRLAKSKPR
jgi:hypothetical protein